jgi:hypothetical protein
MPITRYAHHSKARSMPISFHRHVSFPLSVRFSDSEFWMGSDSWFLCKTHLNISVWLNHVCMKKLPIQNNCKWWPKKMQLFWLIYLFIISSTCFVRCLRPSSGTLDCIYIWYCPPVLLLAGVMDEVPSYPWHQSSWWWAKTSHETCRTD